MTLPSTGTHSFLHTTCIQLGEPQSWHCNHRRRGGRHSRKVVGKFFVSRTTNDPTKHTCTHTHSHAPHSHTHTHTHILSTTSWANLSFGTGYRNSQWYHCRKKINKLALRMANDPTKHTCTPHTHSSLSPYYMHLHNVSMLHAHMAERHDDATTAVKKVASKWQPLQPTRPLNMLVLSLDTRHSRFSACNIEKLGRAWGRG